MTILNQSEEEERTGKKEHVVFLMLQKDKVSRRKAQTIQKDEETGVDRKVCMGYFIHYQFSKFGG